LSVNFTTHFILKSHGVYLQCKTVQVGRTKIAEDKERRGYRKRKKKENIFSLSILPVVSFQMDVVRKVAADGEDKKGL
jgi:hypothetical protein